MRSYRVFLFFGLFLVSLGWLIGCGSSSLGPSSISLTSGQPCEDTCDGECDPRTQGYWQRQCMSFDPNGPGPHPDFTLEELEAMFSETDPKLANVSDPDQTTCEALEAEPASEPCERALKQFAAVLLNIESEYVSSCAYFTFDDGSSMTAEETEDAISQLIASGDPDDCKDAADLSVQINEGTACDNRPGTCTISVVAPDSCNPGTPFVTINGRGFCHGVANVEFLGEPVDFEVLTDRVIQVPLGSAPCGCDPEETGDVVVTLDDGGTCELPDSFTCS